MDKQTVDTFGSIDASLASIQRKAKRLRGRSTERGEKTSEIRVYLFDGEEEPVLATLPMSYNKAVAHLRKIRRGFGAAELDASYDKIEQMEERDE